MMKPVDMIYEELRGADLDYIRFRIMHYRLKIFGLKAKLRDPNHVEDMCPSLEVQLIYTRKYLAAAKRALAEALEK